MQTNRYYARANSLLKSLAVLLLALFSGGCAANEGQTPKESYLSQKSPATEQLNSGPSSAISKTPESRSSANKLVELMRGLESDELEDISSVKEELSELQNEAARTEIGNLMSVKNYLLLWQCCLGDRAGTITEEVNTAYNRTLNDVKKLHIEAEGKTDAQASAAAIPLPRATAGMHGSGSANGNFDWEHSIFTNRTGSRVIKFQGGMSDRNLRWLREESRMAFLSDLRVNGLGLIANSRDLVGYWTWRWTNGKGPATVKLELKADFSMQAKFVPDNPRDWPGGGWVNGGWGNWSINDGVLRIQMVKVGIPPFGVSNPLTFIDNRQIVWFDDHKVILEGSDDNTLEREVH